MTKRQLTRPLAIVSLLVPAWALAQTDPPSAGGRGRGDTPPGALAGQPSVMISLWVVAFDPSIESSKLPFDLKAYVAEASGRRAEGWPDGRTSTAGLARQMAAGDVTVEAGGHVLTMRDGRLVSLPPGGLDSASKPPWQIVTAPRLAVEVGQVGQVSIGEPLSYMEQRDDGCLTVKESDAVEGAGVKLKVEWAREANIRFSEIELEVSRLAGRQPIAGVPFEVGRPIIDTRRTSLGLTLERDQVGVIPLPQREQDAPLLVFLTARPVEPPK